MLRVSLMGNLGSEPEQRYTQRGALMVTFRVAVNMVVPGQDGERLEKTEWFRIRVMGRQTEFASRLAKGNRVFVDGRLTIGEYMGRDGHPRASYEVFADELQLIRGEPAVASDGHASRDSAVDVDNVTPLASARGAQNELEDLPF